MSDSIPPRRSRKAADRPKKPYPDFPLTPHASGMWMKKIRGKIHYFGRWANRVGGKLVRIPGDGWEAALEEYKLQAEDLHAGRTPRARAGGMTVGGLCNHYLSAKLRKKQAGEINGRTFANYKSVCDLIVNTFGVNRVVDDLAADDFARLRESMTRRWGPVRVSITVGWIKGVFRYGTDNGLVEKAVRYGTEFRKPSLSV